MIESSRTVESCLSFYHLKMYEEYNTVTILSFKRNLDSFDTDRTIKVFVRQHIFNNYSRKSFLKHLATCKSGELEGDNSPVIFTWYI